MTSPSSTIPSRKAAFETSFSPTVMSQFDYPDLRKAAFEFPAIDNHAHPLLKEVHRHEIPFEALVSEAEGNAIPDAAHTLACYRATSELAPLLDLTNPSWEDIKSHRAGIDYDELCHKFMDQCNIQSILLDDGLGVAELAESWQWHQKFCHTRRILRVEVEAEKILSGIFHATSILISNALEAFNVGVRDMLTSGAHDVNVVAFKSIACYRTGLDIVSECSEVEQRKELVLLFERFKESGKIRLANKMLNDHLVCMTLQIAGDCGKPVQFHTGLGDNDISLLRSSPSHLQPIIKRYPETTFVLLHSSYPYTREAGYLTAVYSNVFLDFGEVFPFVSGSGQRTIIRQVLELAPTNKILWSTDGHWFPESFYLGTLQARNALYIVLAEIVSSGELTEAQAVTIVQNSLFHNANRIYRLGLTPQTKDERERT
ncbi:amidohydrolase 2 [Mycena floridula]|nr:amidohydrolase 2 [Mycena floridula]